MTLCQDSSQTHNPDVLEKRKIPPAFERRLIDYEEALNLCLSQVSDQQTPTETVPLINSLGRVLRQDVESETAIPPFSKSTMDGYAVKSEDVRSATRDQPVRLTVIDEIPAGSVSDKTVKTGQASRIAVRVA